MTGFAAALAAGTLLGDGAMGTLAQATGARADGAASELVLLAPELVGALHRRYLDAGADVVQTHTYGAGRLRLARHGLARQVHEINVTAARLAREACEDAGRQAFVAGSVSPATSPRAPGSVESAAVRAAIREQAAALAEGGVDVLVCETFAHAEELAEAVEAVREAADLPVVAQATFVDEDGEPVTTLGETPEDVARIVGALRPVALGSNCTLGPQGLLAVVRRMAAAVPDGTPVTALPNAGLPHVVSDRRVRFAADAAHFGRYAARYAAAGARLVGGCCGTTPAHVAAAAAVLAEGPVVDEPVVPPTAGPRVVRDRPMPDDRVGPGRGAFARWLDAPAPRPLLVAEVTGPGSDDLDGHLARARAALGAGAEALWAGRERARRPRITAAGIAAGVHETVDADVALTVTSWNASRMALQADLLGLDALGVHTVVCETGNPPVHADRPVRDGVWEVDAVGLVGLAASMAAGVDADGDRLAPVPFRVGVRVTPGAEDLERELSRVRLKVEAGAEFLVTRPVYELGRLRRVVAGLAATGVRVPVLLTLAPLTGYAEAEHLAHEVPDVVVPDEVLARVRTTGEDPAPGLELAAELAGEALRDGLVAGLVVRRPGPPGLLADAVARLRAVPGRPVVGTLRR
ncbi:homocysteine S-methyltransferase family protein [Actinomycetospora sp. OC33-EN08]|uniref:Homocysteine S-methyltransferase family protein n=1 Tax=Actinomycetospora aurantiaca TaxID=3129233 RepID=A0ABU8MIF7_9PSEU